MTSLPGFFPRVIDSSMLSAFRSCPMKFFREYVQHFKRKGQSIHLHAGGAYAHGLEVSRRAYYEDGRTPGEAENLGLDALAAYYGDFDCPSNSAKTKERMLGALDFYFANYPLDTDLAQPARLPGGKLGIEYSFAQPLPCLNPQTGEPIIFAGRSDMIVEFAGGIYILDDKTTSSLGPSWSDQWEMRGQFTGYSWAARETGIKVAGTLIRGVSILKTKYETQQVNTYRADFEIDRWLTQTVRDIERMRQMWAEGYWDSNLDESCNSYGGCPFKTSCKSADPMPWLETDFEQRVWDPLQRQELSIPAYLEQWENS